MVENFAGRLPPFKYFCHQKIRIGLFILNFFLQFGPNIKKIALAQSCLTLFYMEHSLTFEVLVDELLYMTVHMS